ncbi:MAG: O-acetyl-ADP-ribose deacetylase (regulator of RNase III) [Candidatus Fermentimicrarchaeum limneticum]|uniref:O-acetyl-ADP-ribose deacetylase (Regulator of RNase III) n=1 Tax=Fermentimicrarchaeum limneticum TaxID=2795018 RepID=A0A7D6BUH7_FERL1|nr:MAG: O-acetyl-ADP-ribose deacetylase (regulator of RNase III) [Candidatus Fermentimicrarchaeum limneticum]
MFQIEYKGVVIRVVKGDITKIEADAIVNPANSFGFMGGGVALAIKRAGGDEIEKEAVGKAPIAIGKAVATTAGKLNAKFVIHAPTMTSPAGETDVEKVKEATIAALRCAEENRAKSVAFPGMGTGVGGLSYEAAAEAMAESIKEFSRKSKTVKEIILIGYGRELADCFVNALKD